MGKILFSLLIMASFLPLSFASAAAENSMGAYIDGVLGMRMATKPSPSYQRPSTGSRYVPAYRHRTFGGYECTDDCSGHKAGYEWAERNDITDEYDCVASSISFEEGCNLYVYDPYLDPDFDDDGKYIP